MALIEINTNPTDRQLRQFAGVVLPLVGLVAAVILAWRLAHPTAAWIVAVIAAAICVAGLVRPAVVRPAYVGWIYAAYPVGWVIGHVVVGVIFFLVLTPIALVMRWLGREPLQRKFDVQRESYWEPRDMPSDRSRYFRQF